jgi:hypothetical protein
MVFSLAQLMISHGSCKPKTGSDESVGSYKPKTGSDPSDVHYEVGDLAIDSNGTVYNTTVPGMPTKQFSVHKPAWRPKLSRKYIWVGPLIIKLDPEDPA